MSEPNWKRMQCCCFKMRQGFYDSRFTTFLKVVSRLRTRLRRRRRQSAPCRPTAKRMRRLCEMLTLRIFSSRFTTFLKVVSRLRTRLRRRRRKSQPCKTVTTRTWRLCGLLFTRSAAQPPQGRTKCKASSPTLKESSMKTGQPCVLDKCSRLGPSKSHQGFRKTSERSAWHEQLWRRLQDPRLITPSNSPKKQIA